MKKILAILAVFASVLVGVACEPGDCTGSQEAGDLSCLPPPEIVWADEFNGTSGSAVNASEWEQQVGGATNNGRVEYDTAGTQNLAMDGSGNLVITARRENTSYIDKDGHAQVRNFTAARIESYHSFTTGYLEFRAKLPHWAGLMPGLWTYGAAGYGPESGYIEADVVEMQTQLEPTMIRQTIHGQLPGVENIWQLGWSNNRPDFAPAAPGDDWHTYGVYINAFDKSVTFYVDGVSKARYEQGQQPAGGSWPYTVYANKVVIEIEMGGYSGYPAAGTNSDQMLVDYVRLYERKPY